MTLGGTFRRTGKFKNEYRRRLEIFINRIIHHANQSIDDIDGLADILESARDNVFRGEDYLSGYPFVLLKLGYIQFDGKERRFRLLDTNYPNPKEANIEYVSRRIGMALRKNPSLRYLRPKSIESRYVTMQNIAASFGVLEKERRLRHWKKGSNVYEIVDKNYFLSKIKARA